MTQKNGDFTSIETRRVNKRITLPLDLAEYQKLVADPRAFRAWVDTNIARSPELFPANITEGYTLHDMRNSAKMPEVPLRRIKLKALDAQGQAQVFTIAPSGVMPYMTGKPMS